MPKKGNVDTILGIVVSLFVIAYTVPEAITAIQNNTLTGVVGTMFGLIALFAVIGLFYRQWKMSKGGM